MAVTERPASIDDVAVRAGVSATTVSHVLNDVPGKRIRPETRERVRQAAQELRYVPNSIARSLRTRRSQVIAVVGDEIATTPFAFGLIRGAQMAAAALGWLLIQVSTGVDRAAEDDEIRALLQRQVDGFLYARMYNAHVDLPEILHGLPVVIVDGTAADPTVCSVAPDEFGGGRRATQELIDHGHSAIAFLNNIDDIPASRDRLAGYRSAMEQAGLDVRGGHVVRARSDSAGGLDGARRLLDLEDRPTAVFCFNDRMAMGAYHAAHERGLRIPQDLSVVGFDNQSGIADGVFPNLTTIGLPHDEMGAWAVRTLVDQLTRPEEVEPAQILLNCPLVKGASVAAPPLQADRPPGAQNGILPGGDAFG